MYVDTSSSMRMYEPPVVIMCMTQTSLTRDHSSSHAPASLARSTCSASIDRIHALPVQHRVARIAPRDREGLIAPPQGRDRPALEQVQLAAGECAFDVHG